MEERDNIETTRQTYEKIAKWYAEKHIPMLWITEQEKFRSYLKEKAKILDVGCGPGRDTKYFSDCDYDVIGIDFASAMLDEAKRRFPNCKFKLMDMRKLTFGHESFDGLWCCASLLHFRREELPDVLNSLKRVLKRDGILFVGIKKGEGKREEWRTYPDGTMRYFSYYNDENEFKRILESNGFIVLEYHLRIEPDQDRWHCFYAKKA